MCNFHAWEVEGLLRRAILEKMALVEELMGPILSLMLPHSLLAKSAELYNYVKNHVLNKIIWRNT